ncbi:MAG TPA: ABC transporter permease [Anaerolineae bacterium]|nr:ABC transporter permease [Anaerolineae bacterium]
MSVRMVLVLLRKELIDGPKSFMFILAVVLPLILTLLLSAGDLFDGKGGLGVVAAEDSQFLALAQEVASIDVVTYADEASLRAAVERGEVDLGIVVPAGLEEMLASGEMGRLEAYIWGESLLKHRLLLGTTLVTLLRELAGQEIPVDIRTTTVGTAVEVPLEERLLPVVVLISILFGSLMVTATSVVEEKLKGTLRALTVTPATWGDVLMAKGVMGVLVSVVMAIVVLVLNGGWGERPFLLLLTLVSGAVGSATFGVLLGLWAKDVNSLFATIKSLGLFLYAPAFIYFFPSWPQWLGRVFPTYYILEPVIAVSQRGEGLGGVVAELGVMVVMVLGLWWGIGQVVEREKVGH